MPRQPTNPFAGPQQQQPGGGMDDVRKALASRQQQGVTSGGAIAPDSIAAIMGGGQGVSPQLMQLITQFMQQSQGR